MSRLNAGFGKVELPVPVGVELVGYPNREGPALGVRDALHARALVLEDADGQRAALCALDLCYVMEDVVAAARERVAVRGLVPSNAVCVTATHTHSGPDDADSAVFPDGLDALIAQAVAQACERLEPARVGAGMGTLHGLSINRRRLEDPVDPALLVLRVDAADGRPLGLVHAFGCHPVVLGPDSRLVSADWPGESCRRLEAALGEGAVVLFVQGASGDVNPLTDGVRARLGEGRVVVSTAQLDHYYGPERPPWEIGDRIGGTDAELEAIGRAVTQEALRVRRGVATGTDGGIWTRSLAVAIDDGPSPIPSTMTAGLHRPRVAPGTPLEVTLLGLEGPGVMLVGMPGEPFAESGFSLRWALRAAGVRHPFTIGQANGRRAYLPPAQAFADGGYEVEWAQTNGFPETLQDDIRAAVLAALANRSGAVV
jgi:neutral ceramidase